MVLDFLGRETPVREVRDVLGSGRSGVTARDLLEAARRFGLRTRGLKLEVEDLRHLPRGAVLHWGFDHFVVFDRLRRDGAVVVDPAVGEKRVFAADLREHFTGVALVFEPAGDFRPRRHKQRSLARYFLGLVAQRGILARTVVLSVALQILALALPLLIGLLVDRVVPLQDRSLLRLLAAGAAAVVAFQVLIVLLRAYLLNYLKAALDAQLSLGFVEHLANLPLRFFVQRTSGDLLARFESNRNLRQTLTGASISTLMDGSLVFGYLALLAWADLRVGAVVLGLGLLQVVLFLAFRKPTRALAAAEIEAISKAQGHLVELLAGMETLKAMGGEKRAAERWSHWFVKELNVTLARARIGAIAGALAAGIQVGAPMAILLLGAYEVLEGRISLATMLTLQALAAGFLLPLGNLVAVALQLQEARGHIDRIEDVLEHPPEQDPARPLRTLRLAGAIRAESLRFRYHPREDWTIRDVSVAIEPGHKVAIVGRSGAGKSTLARLLLGLYRPESGTIRFDGVDLAEIDLPALRSQIGVVTQDARVFGMSLRDNLSLANPSVAFEEIVAAARLAEIHDEIEALPLGYDTRLTDGGAALSGGQRQRIALARALAGRPSILLFDEATSDLDTLTERKVSENLRGLGCTRIVIAHRLSTIADADTILVLANGVLVESGTHETLLAEKGEYRRLIDAQLAPRSS